jgi:hypothetical protein
MKSRGSRGALTLCQGLALGRACPRPVRCRLSVTGRSPGQRAPRRRGSPMDMACRRFRGHRDKLAWRGLGDLGRGHRHRPEPFGVSPGCRAPAATGHGRCHRHGPASAPPGWAGAPATLHIAKRSGGVEPSSTRAARSCRARSPLPGHGFKRQWRRAGAGPGCLDYACAGRHRSACRRGVARLLRQATGDATGMARPPPRPDGRAPLQRCTSRNGPAGLNHQAPERQGHAAPGRHCRATGSSGNGDGRAPGRDASTTHVRGGAVRRVAGVSRACCDRPRAMPPAWPGPRSARMGGRPCDVANDGTVRRG